MQEAQHKIRLKVRYRACAIWFNACRIIERFYADGGNDFYPILLPVTELVDALGQANLLAEQAQMTELFTRHADKIALRGQDFPSREVNFEQSIVAPAADILLSVYEITGKPQYLEVGRKIMNILELFNERQPDYHLHEVAIRHWDGYWFGKRRLYGDTFPHYWSALTGRVFAKYAKATGEVEYANRAEDSFRAILPLYREDGSGSCAYIYPKCINGIIGEFYDTYANDQDWGLYLILESCQAHQKLCHRIQRQKSARWCQSSLS